ncbi:peroxisomal multifunctional enzyme type 2-like [Centruroides sculpturatus]|uniref:peroxisomal multifunctional enzyme type 2-like n=2 Tax=Centruroides sculpturatus TaxID=218467 RepID=UPI000C6ED637|nr:peroxisomal multifunctional enzyme type 2-like [Centruroides sculpturatus]
MALLNFTGRVAVVTGAGGGLGRHYALELAERGASVVVNDLGGDRAGQGKGSLAADKVVQEIRKKGGKAIPDYNSVEEGDKIVATAIKNFGRIDILINNAGILRDKSFLNMTIEEWDMVHRVHLRGAFLITKAAWPYFRKQNYGKVIMTASSAGIYGNFGQANYSSAKLGLVGLSKTLAIEGAKYGIHCNTIIPVAASRLTEDVLPEELFTQLKPELVSPVVTWLCHETCLENGGVFEAAGGWIGKFQWQRSIGKAFQSGSLTPENVRDNWKEITDLNGATSPLTVQEEMQELIEAMTGQLQVKHSSSANGAKYTYTPDSAILYALGIGVSSKQDDYLNFLYEGSENFSVLPTFGILPGMCAVFDFTPFQEEMQRLNADPTKMLHGEQYLELYQPLNPAGTLYSTCRLVDTIDKGSGAVIVADVDTFNENGEKVAYNQWVVFLVGAGNFGGKRNSEKIKAVLPTPNRPADSVIEETTHIDQAALYRLSGDKNPIHIDPVFASLGGYSKPIMHGLCSLGFAARHVLKQYANNDVKKFKAIKARFARPIEPGQTIRTEMWNEGGRVYFQSSVAETNKPLLSGGYVDFVTALPTEVPKSNVTLKSDAVFLEIGRRLQGMPELASKIKAIYQWNILKNGQKASQWIVDLKNGQGSVYRGEAKNEKPGCVLTLDDDDIISLASGKMDAQKAFMTGKLKISGNLFLAEKLRPLLNGRTNNNQNNKNNNPSNDDNSKKNPQLKSDQIFMGMRDLIKSNPDLSKRIQKIYQWNINKDGKLASQWTLDLKTDSGDLYRGVPKSGKANCTLILEDDLFADISNGKVDPQKAFMSGKFKIQGEILATQRLQDVWKSSPPVQKKPVPTEKVEINKSENSTIEEPPSYLKADILFGIFAERLHEEPDLAKKMKMVYHWTILKDKKKATEWTIDLKTEKGAIYKGPPKTKPDVTLIAEDEDLIMLLLGKLNPQRAFMTGRLRIKGNIMLTQKLHQLWQEILKSKKAAELPVLASIFADKPLDTSLKSEGYIVSFAKKISKMTNLQTRIGSIFELNITKNKQPVKQWTLDLKSSQLDLYRGKPKSGKSNSTITLEDNTFAEWVTEKLPGQTIIQNNLVGISGDKAAAEKLLNIFSAKSKL